VYSWEKGESSGNPQNLVAKWRSEHNWLSVHDFCASPQCGRDAVRLGDWRGPGS
jgi:hypothetical protein